MAEYVAIRGLTQTRGFVDLPRVSVVIPCLNRRQFLVPTIESVLQQDYPSVECIVMDGGSTDGTLDILRRYDGRIQWVSEPDQGPPDAINKGWQKCTGEILAWLNADDLWAPGAVGTAVSYLQEHPEADVVYGDCGIIDQEGVHITTIRVRDWDLGYAVKYCDHIIYQAASFMRRSILQRVGWLYPKLCHDHELWLRISLAGGNLQHIPTLLAHARDHIGNLGYQSDIVIPLKLEITRELFANPHLPRNFHEIRDRTLSNAHLRGIDYVFFGGFRWRRDTPRALDLVRKAFGADSSNLFGILKYLLKLGAYIPYAIIRPYLPDRLMRALRILKYRAKGLLLGFHAWQR